MAKPRKFPLPVIVERMDGDCNSDFDAPAGRWVVAFRERVAFRTMSPMEKQAAEQLHAGAVIKLVARWSSRWNDVLRGGQWRIHTTAGLYAIQSLVNVEERNELVEILAERTSGVAA